MCGPSQYAFLKSWQQCYKHSVIQHYTHRVPCICIYPQPDPHPFIYTHRGGAKYFITVARSLSQINKKINKSNPISWINRHLCLRLQSFWICLCQLFTYECWYLLLNALGKIAKSLADWLENIAKQKCSSIAKTSIRLRSGSFRFLVLNLSGKPLALCVSVTLAPSVLYTVTRFLLRFGSSHLALNLGSETLLMKSIPTSPYYHHHASLWWWWWSQNLQKS